MFVAALLISFIAQEKLHNVVPNGLLQWLKLVMQQKCYISVVELYDK